MAEGTGEGWEWSLEDYQQVPSQARARRKPAGALASVLRVREAAVNTAKKSGLKDRPAIICRWSGRAETRS
jgi:hypothetical protein